MKPLRGKRNHGSTLMICLVTCGIIGIVLASYLTLVSNRYNMNTRSRCWNEAMPVLEAGIEEALTHLHDDAGSPTANVWTPAVINGATVYTKKRTFADGSYFNVMIYNATTLNPTIYSSGYVPAPGYGKSGYIYRTVRVNASSTQTFTHAIATSGTIAFSGGAMVDSYHSSYGAYGGTNSFGPDGNIATDSTNHPAIDVNNGRIFGSVDTGPGGTVTISGGSVGDTSFVTNSANKGNIESGYSNDTMTVSFPTNFPPPGGPFLAPSVLSTNGSNITMVTGGTFQMPSFTSSDSTKPMFVTGNATVYVTGDVTVSGSGYIEIFPGGSLTLIIGGKSSTVSGGGIVNGTGMPADFSLVGLNTCSNLTYNGSAALIGTINAPEADVNVSGSAGVYGAAICASYSSSGGSAFHFDDSLNAVNNLVISSWVETF